MYLLANCVWTSSSVSLVSGALEFRDPLSKKVDSGSYKNASGGEAGGAVDCRGDEVAGEPGDAGESAGGKW